MPVAFGLIDPHDLTLPHLPDRLVGFRIAHLSDLHAWRATNNWTRLAHQLSGLRLDMVLFTGDYTHKRTREDLAVAAMKQLTDNLRPVVGCFGVFGNHDHEAMRQLATTVPITWLTNQTLRLDNLPIELLGLDSDHDPRDDAVEMILPPEAPAPEAPPPEVSTPEVILPEVSSSSLKSQTSTLLSPDNTPRLRLLLHHYPDSIMTAADLGVDLMFTGHTHGGHCRLPTGHTLVNCSSLPRHLTSGILRHRNMLMAVSRGIGSRPMVPRLFCHPHVPVYTLRKGPMLGQFTEGIDNVKRW